MGKADNAFNAISKEDRIKMHCPVRISPMKSNPVENWSFAFADKRRMFFKVETQQYYSISYGPQVVVRGEDNYLIRWLLMSPGIGFWMTDVAGNSRKYLMPNQSKLKLYLNNKLAFEQLP